MKMKPVSLDINVECAGARKSYGALIDEEHILDVTRNGEYLEANRGAITQNFMALALYDCSKLIFDDIKGKITDGETPITHN